VLGVCVLFFIFYLILATYSLYKAVSNYFYPSGHSNLPSIYEACERHKDNYIFSINISTYNKEMKNVNCKLVSTGGMTPNKEEKNITIIPPNSSYFCEFTLKGERVGAIRARVSYLLKSFQGYKQRSTIIEPQCFSNEVKPEG